MDAATFVCNKNDDHRHALITNDVLPNREKCYQCDGWMYPHNEEQIMESPFELQCLIGGWKPACTKHKLIFMFRSRYYRKHGKCKGGAYPPSDLAIKSGYRKVWLP